MLLKKLSEACGPSGYEDEVRDIIKDEIKDKISDKIDEMFVDKMGNIIVHKKGIGKKVVIDVHMDEVAFIITAYNEDGTLKFASTGHIDSKAIPCKVLFIGENKIIGVIGMKPIHLQGADERNRTISYSDCCIDIGSNSKEETKKIISLGDYASFSTKYNQFGEGLIKGKALDDRIGCNILLDILKENFKCDFYGIFNVQEEVGKRGAYTSSFYIKPDIAIALDTVNSADMPNIPKHLSAANLGKGPAISIMDETIIFDSKIYDKIIEIAKVNGIPYQYNKSISGSNDAGAIYMSGEGSSVATVLVPCRYTHSSVSVANIEDIKNTKELIIAYLKSI